MGSIVKTIPNQTKNYIRVSGGNAFGSTNTAIRSFSSSATALESVGTDITYADTSANGASFTINAAGLYQIDYQDRNDSSAMRIGISKNATGSDLTTALESIADTKILGQIHTPGTALVGTLTRSVWCVAGDVLRPHLQASISGLATATVGPRWTITQVYKL